MAIIFKLYSKTILFLLFIIFAEFILFKTSIQCFPRFDIIYIVILIKYFKRLANIYFLFIIGIFRDIVYIAPVGITSVIYIVLFLVLSKYQKTSILLVNHWLKLFINFFFIIFFSFTIQWTMNSIFLKELLPVDKLIIKILYTGIFYLIIDFIYKKLYSSNINDTMKI